MRRRLLILLVILVLLAIVVVGIAEAVLRSDMPRQIAVEQIEQITGLDAEIEAVELGWSGSAVVRGLQLKSPLEQEPFLELETLTAELRPLLLVAVTGDPGLQRVEVDGVDLAMRQHRDGRWNLLEVIERFEADPDAPAGDPVTPPQIALRNTTVTIDDNAGRRARLEDITVTGEPLGAMGFTFDATAQPGLAASGNVDLRGPMRHRVNFEVDGVRKLLDQWLEGQELPAGDLTAAGMWSGRMADAQLQGRLAVTAMKLGPMRGDGVLRVEAGGEDGPAVNIERWVARVNDQPIEQVVFTGGRIAFVDEQVRVSRLELAAMQNRLWVDGAWSPITREGSASLRWSGRMAEQWQLDHDGEAELNIAPINPEQQRVTATIASSGSAEAGTWDAEAQITGSGALPGKMTWQLRVPRGTWTDADRSLDFADTQAELIADLPNLTLTGLRLAGQPITGEAHGDLTQRTFEASLATQQWQPPLVDLPAAVDFELEAQGDPAAVFVRHFSLAMGDYSADASGKYMFGADRPLEAHVRAVAEQEFAGESGESDDDAEDAPTGPQFAGRVTVEGDVRGAVAPLSLEFDGETQAEQLVINHRPLHDVTAPIEAEVDQQRVTVRTPGHVDVLDGQVGIALRYAPADGTTEMGVQLVDVPLGRVAPYAGGDIRATGVAQASLVFSVPEGDVSRLRAQGEWEAEDIRLERLGEFARLDRASGELATEPNRLRLNPIQLELGEGVALGEATFNLADGRTLQAELNVSDWPVDLEAQQLATRVGGDVTLNMDVVEADIAGAFDIATDVEWRDRSVGQLAVVGELTEQTLTVEELAGDVFGGEVRGDAHVAFDNLYATRADVRWEAMDLSVVEPWLGREGDFTGRVAGSIHVMPAQLPRPPEPLQIELRLEPEDGEARFRETPLRRSAVTLFAGPERFVLEDSHIAVADGAVDVWAQAVPRDGRWFAQTRTELERLDIDLLNRSIDPEAAAIVGRLSGNVSAFGFLDDPATLAGDGTIRLSESDLAQSSIIGAVYQTMNLNFTDTDPTGAGRVRLRADGGALRIEEFQYFNRGVDVYGTATIDRVLDGAQSPLDATLIGTLRPLRGVDLPFASDIDRLLRSLQTVAGSIRVDGTVGEPRTRQATLADVQSTIERILGEQQRD